MRKTVILRFKEADKDGLILPRAESERDWDLVRAYIETHGGEKGVQLAQTVARAWAEIESKPGYESRCTGVVGIRQIWDVPFFHVEDGIARIRLLRRASTVLEETCAAGERALVHVAPESEDEWKNFLTAMAGFPAHRWSVPVALGE